MLDCVLAKVRVDVKARQVMRVRGREGRLIA